MLNLILCWHMHQPDYRDQITREFTLPWTYLHAIKDYTDMAFHLENHPGARAVFNFVPVLLDQLEDYAAQFATGEIRDPLLRLLPVEDMGTLTDREREIILDSCFRSNHNKMIEPYPGYKRLHGLYKFLEPEGEAGMPYLSAEYMADLITWYHLAWCGESVRRGSELVAHLMAKGIHFTPTERRQLFDLIGSLIQGLIPRYRKLAEEGRIELSTTPYYHPIVPLLIDFECTREAMPDAALPAAPGYPGGRERAAFHIRAALDGHRRCFGVEPAGMWPAEGGVSQEAAILFAQHGCRWLASGEQVLVNSLRRAAGEPHPLPERREYLYRPYRVAGDGGEISCFFRDDPLSDLIGFEYAKWFGKDAVDNFVHRLEEIQRQTAGQENPVVSVILDGENAWEYYPYNGYYFLSGLYEALENHPHIRMTTFRDYLDTCSGGRENAVQHELQFADADAPDCAAPGELPYLVAGSWVYGNFATWIGSPDKNRAWDLLCAAKARFDEVMAQGALNEEEKALARRQLADCEGSDWFWWFGDYNPQHSVESFDRLYRQNLKNLYRLLKSSVPAELDQPISHGGGQPEAGGAMRRAS